MSRGLYWHFAGIDQKGGAIGENVESGIAAAGADLVDVQGAGFPRQHRLPHGISRVARDYHGHKQAEA